MPVDLLWTSIGFIVGVAATAFALEVAFRRVRNDERASMSRDWRLDRLATDGPPGIVATSLEGVAVPPGSRVLVSPGAKLPREIARTCKIRIHPDAKGNFAVGSGGAILCTGPMIVGTLAVQTLHPSLVSKIDRSFETLWMQGRDYTQKVAVSEIEASTGTTVEVEGKVIEVLSSGDKALVRLEGTAVGGHGGVLVPANLPLQEGQSYAFTGTVVHEAGRTMVKAEHVRPLQTA